MQSSKNIPSTVREQFTKINSIGLQVLERDYDGFIFEAKGLTVPTGEGFAKGCRFLKADTANNSNPFYYNYGDNATAKFVNDDIGQNTLNVLSFGAVGNGVNDDTVAINAALAASVNSIVLLPAGYIFLISAPLVINSKTILESYGAEIRLKSGSNSLLIWDSDHAVGSGAVDHITVRGGIWNKQGNTGTGVQSNFMLLGGSRLEIRDIEFLSTAGKECIKVQNASDFYINNIFLNNVFSGGVQIEGPCVRGIIKNVYGTAGDDTVAIVPNDWAQYTANIGGDVTDIVIDTVIGNGSATSLVKIISATNGATVYNTKRITAHNIKGSVLATVNAAVYLGDDTSQANTQNGQLDDITVDDVNVTYPDGHTAPYIIIQGSSTSLTIPNITLSNIKVSGDFHEMVYNTGKVTNLRLNNISIKTNTLAMVGGIVNMVNLNSQVTNLQVTNLYGKFAGANGSIVLANNTTAIVLTNVSLVNVYTDGLFQLSDLLTNTTFYLTNVNMLNNSRIFNVRSPGVVVVGGATSCNFANTSSAITSTGTLESKSLNFPLDVSNAQVVKNAGDMAYNTQSSIARVGPVVCDGVKWSATPSILIKFDHFADVGNTHTDGSTFDDLFTDTIPASVLNRNADKIIAEYAGIFAAHATATRNLDVLFGGTIILNTGAFATTTAEIWNIKVTVIRVSSTVVRCTVTVVATTATGTNAFTQTVYTEITGLTLTNTQIIKVVGVSGGVGAAANDVIAKLGTVSFSPAA